VRFQNRIRKVGMKNFIQALTTSDLPYVSHEEFDGDSPDIALPKAILYRDQMSFCDWRQQLFIKQEMSRLFLRVLSYMCDQMGAPALAYAPDRRIRTLRPSSR